MKNIIRKSVIAASFVIAIAASSFKANATENKLIYDKSVNPTIGITIENANGATYTVKDEKGNIILSGKVKGDKTLHIATSKLQAGTYKFYIGGNAVQAFEIK